MPPGSTMTSGKRTKKGTEQTKLGMKGRQIAATYNISQNTKGERLK